MTSFTHTDFPKEHRGVTRAEAAFAAASQLGQGFNGTRGIAALLLAAAVSAVLVLADRLVNTGSSLLATWIVTWVMAFVALALFAGPAGRMAAALMRHVDGWSASLAEARADQRTWEVARADARVMGELQAAAIRAEAASTRATTTPATAASTPAASVAAQSMAPAAGAMVELRAAVPKLRSLRSYYYYL